MLVARVRPYDDTFSAWDAVLLHFRSVAQLDEHLSSKQEDVGSTPSRPTN